MKKTNNGTYKTIGASNHVKEERDKHDYYATEPKAVYELLKQEDFNKNIWECACGEGHISKVLQSKNYKVKSSDLIDRNFGSVFDFLRLDNTSYNGDIITNPPYSTAELFIEKALNIIPKGNKVAFLLRTLFLESKSRKELFRAYPPKTVYISSGRLKCAKGGDFDTANSAISFSWFVWEKGYKGNTVVKWIN